MSVETRSSITLAVPAGSGRNRSTATVTTEPLLLGPESITPAGIPGLVAVRLTAVHLLWDNLNHEVLGRVADDLFGVHSSDDDYHDLFPSACAITEATFDFYFSDSPTPRSVTIRPPNDLIL